jgi:hypothetical protein
MTSKPQVISLEEAPHVPPLPGAAICLTGFPSEAVAVAGGEGVNCSPAWMGSLCQKDSEAYSCVVRVDGAYLTCQLSKKKKQKKKKQKTKNKKQKKTKVSFDTNHPCVVLIVFLFS